MRERQPAGALLAEAVVPLAAVRAEVLRLARVVARLTVVVADATVQTTADGPPAVALLRRGRLRGGGGTDHRPVFAWLTERRRRPDLFVGLTDLESRFPERPPPYPVLWVVPEGGAVAPWGRRVTLPP